MSYFNPDPIINVQRYDEKTKDDLQQIYGECKFNLKSNDIDSASLLKYLQESEDFVNKLIKNK